MKQYSPRDKNFELLLLHLVLRLRHPCPLAHWALILDMPEDRLHVRLTALPPNSGLLYTDKILRADTESVACRTLMRRVPLPPADDDTASSALWDLLFGQVVVGAETLVRSALPLLRARSYGGAMLQLGMVIDALRNWQGETASYDMLRRYSYLFITLMEIYLTFGYRPLRKAVRLYGRACRFARSMGDKRTETLLNLMLGLWTALRYYRRHRGGKNTLLRRALQQVEELGDDDIRTLTVDFKVIFYATQGNIHPCISLYMAHSAPITPWISVYLHTCGAIVAAAAAVYGGRVHEGFGVLEAPLRVNPQPAQYCSREWLHVQLANLLIVVGKYDEALEHLDTVAHCISPTYQPVHYVLFTRTLAYYHWKMGRPAASYAVFAQAVTHPSHKHMHTVYYGYPWFFELLHGYAEQGYAPVHGYDLEQEINRAIGASNSNLHGVALRYKALLAHQRGAPPAAVLNLLQQSFTVLQAIDNQLELANTRLELANMLELTGEHVRATTHRQIALQLLTATGTLPPPRDDALQQEVLTRLHACMNQPPDWHSAESYCAHFARMGQHIFQAERVALFALNTLQGKVPDTQEQLRTVVAIPTVDTTVPPPQMFDDREQHAYILNLCSQGIPGTYSSHGALLCLCLRGNDQTYVLTLGNTYLHSIFAALTPQSLEKIVFFLSTHFSMALSLWQARSQLMAPSPALTATTAPIFFLDNMPAVQAVVRQAASADVPVLIFGETGVGKEVLAQHIHQCSGRTGPFVPIHPASLSEHLFESELFGHEKGSFTGAMQQKIGLLELAHKGTLFIDEVGDIPMPLQVKLLRVLQEHQFMRVGGTRQLYSDFRVISATHRNIQELIAGGDFRQDLFYRIAVIPITLPPLRHNRDHLISLTQKFFAYYSLRHHKTLPPLPPTLLGRIADYPWPGNIRQLKNAVERAIILYEGGALDIRPFDAHSTDDKGSAASGLPQSQFFDDLPTMDALQRAYLDYVLHKTAHKICGPGGAEQILGMKRSTLYSKIKEYGLSLKAD